MGKIKVNPSTGKILVSKDSAGISKLCTTCCKGSPGYRYPGVCVQCFGAGRTPQFVTVIFANIEDCPGKYGDATIFNKEWKLELIECLGGFGYGEWRYEDTDVIVSFFKQVVTFPYPHVIECGFKDGFQILQPFAGLRGPDCSDAWCCDAYTNLWTDCIPAYGFNGTATVWPLWWEPWVTDILYLVDGMVSHGGSGYECTVDHTSNSNTEPGVGVDWATVWSLRSDPCDDEGICP